MKIKRDFLKPLFLFVIFFATIIMVARASATEIINTGDDLTVCIGEQCIDTDLEFPTTYPSPTPFPTPTGFRDEGNVNEGNINLPCLFGCPTPTVTPTVTVTPSPTATPAPTEVPVGGPTSDGGSSGSSSAPANNPGQTLGAATMAPTGVFADTMAYLFLMAGIAILGVAGIKYVKEIR